MAALAKSIQTTRPTAAGIYGRISLDRTGEAAGVARQEADCRALAKKRGWPIAGVYIDNDLSAYSGKLRPEYRRLLEDIRSGSIDAVVTWHPDRLHRRPIELEQFFEICDAAGLRHMASVAGDYDLASDDARLNARIMAAVARKSSDDMRRRIRRKHLELAQLGKTHGGGDRAFGYDPYDKKARRAGAIRPAEARVIRDGARRVLAGQTLRSIARRWNEAGIKTSTGRSWYTTGIREVLNSARIAGLREYEGELYKAEWQPIIDRATHERLRNLFGDPLRRTNRVARKYLLAGFARCGACGQKLVARPREAECSRVLEMRAHAGALLDAIGERRAQLRTETNRLGRSRSGYTLWTIVRSLTRSLEAAARSDARIKSVLAEYGLVNDAGDLTSDAIVLVGLVGDLAEYRRERDAVRKQLAARDHVVMSQKDALRLKVKRKCLTCGAASMSTPTYVCATGATGPGFGGCGKVRRMAKPLEELAGQLIVERVDGPELARALREQERQASRRQPEKGDLTALEQQIDELARDFAKKRITRREWLIARDELQGQIDTLQASIRREQRTTVLTPYLAGRGSLAKAWPSLSHDERRAIIAVVIDQVKVNPAKAGVNRFDPNLIEPIWRL